MVIIDLRSYIFQIKQLIDTGQTEEAISHCLHILQSYPKYLDIYRVLGEAQLERGDHPEAADIFQRVLSSIPDDFVAHIGMSVIREEDQKLDEAIWHMERAFELQPSNSAIQSEIKRLYNMREGLEPKKVRLTRGALARMYIKGSLYPQAIGELQAALTEDQNRFDLKVLLSDVYFLSGNDEDGIKTADEVLQTLPYCYGANLTLAKYYQNASDKIKSRQYIDRLVELDPYFAHLEGLYGSTSDIPDDKVEIEKFVSTPRIETVSEEDESLPEMIEIESHASEEVVKAAAITEIETSRFKEDENELQGVEIEEADAVDELMPVKHSDWEHDQSLESDEKIDPILEEDTKPVVVTPVIDEPTLIEEIEEAESEQEGDIPDWLMELTEKETTDETQPVTEPDSDLKLESSKEEQKVKIETSKDISTSPEEGFDKITQTRYTFEAGNREEALSQYSELIKSRKNISAVIKELEKIAAEFPEDAAIQQKLGDAYLRNNQISEALQAFSRAEKLK